MLAATRVDVSNPAPQPNPTTNPHSNLDPQRIPSPTPSPSPTPTLKPALPLPLTLTAHLSPFTLTRSPWRCGCALPCSGSAGASDGWRPTSSCCCRCCLRWPRSRRVLEVPSSCGHSARPRPPGSPGPGRRDPGRLGRAAWGLGRAALAVWEAWPGAWAAPRTCTHRRSAAAAAQPGPSGSMGCLPPPCATRSPIPRPSTDHPSTDHPPGDGR